MRKVKQQAQRSTRISRKHQVTVPVAALREAGLGVGDRLIVRVDGPGRIVLERAQDILAEFSGILTGVWEPGELDRLRDEWE